MIVLVTGGSGDIGSEICRRLADEGHQVAVHFHKAKDRADTLAREIGGMALRADLSSLSKTRRLVAQVAKIWGGVDALVNTAGLPINRTTKLLWDIPFEKTTARMYRNVYDVDTLGTVHAVQAVLPAMKKKRYGKIVNFVSTPAVNGHDRGHPFTAAKGAVLSLTKSLALELGRLGITINAIALGTIETHWMDLYDPKMKKKRGLEIPMGRIGQPSDVSPLVSYLVSPGSDWMTGQTLILDGGEVRL